MSLGKEFVAVFHHLMGTADEINIVLFVESTDDLLPESEGNTTIVFTPALNILVGVGPEEIAEETSVGDISGPHNAFDLLERGKLGAETTVHAKNLLIDDGGDGKAVEAVSEGLPEFDVVAALALIIETVDTVDGGALVVASKEEEILRVLDLVGEQEANSLKRLLATVNVVTKEQVVGIRGEATILEEPQKVVVLPMDIT